MINQIRGILREVGEEKVTLTVGPFDLEVLIPGNAMRPLQGKVDEMIFLHTIFDIEGNQLSGRMAPRLIGFLTELDREFFEILCSVDGMGVRKSLRAMARPVREIARLIQDRDLKILSTFPGIGEAMAERIVAKIRRKVGKFALIVGRRRRGRGGRRIQRPPHRGRARRDSGHLRRAALRRPQREPGARTHRPRPRRRQAPSQVPQRPRYDRGHLPGPG